MNPTYLLPIAVAGTVLFLLRHFSLISPHTAHKHLKKGALVIDVRTDGEFRAGHLANALHFPVDVIDRTLPQRVKDKNQVLLLHCQSGIRSGIAKKRLRSLGYAHTYNLGSYARAARIVGGA